MRSVKAPADAGLPGPLMQQRQLRRANAKALADGADIQQIEDFADREAQRRRIEQVRQGAGQRHSLLLAAI